MAIATLIHAAPELRDALREWIEPWACYYEAELHELRRHGLDAATLDRILKARALLAKLEGK